LAIQAERKTSVTPDPKLKYNRLDKRPKIVYNIINQEAAEKIEISQERRD